MDVGTIIATGAVALVSATVGALVPGWMKLRADASAREAARLEVVADLAGELLEGCERYRGAKKDIVVMDRIAANAMEGLAVPRSPVSRQRDEDRARLRSLAVRISARHRELGDSARRLVDAAMEADGWDAARTAFMDDLAGTIR